MPIITVSVKWFVALAEPVIECRLMISWAGLYVPITTRRLHTIIRSDVSIVGKGFIQLVKMHHADKSVLDFFGLATGDLAELPPGIRLPVNEVENQYLMWGWARWL